MINYCKFCVESQFIKVLWIYDSFDVIVNYFQSIKKVIKDYRVRKPSVRATDLPPCNGGEVRQELKNSSG